MSATTPAPPAAEVAAPAAPSTPSPTKSRSRKRPGKNARSSTPKSTTSVAASDVNPQPGRFLPVFAAAPVNPSKYVNFAYDGDVLADGLTAFFEPIKALNVFRTFLFLEEMTEDELRGWFFSGFCLGLAQRTIFAHANLKGNPGDFGAVRNLDVRLLRSVATALTQFGEFNYMLLGTQFQLAGYPYAVQALIRAAHLIDLSDGTSEEVESCLESMWLPLARFDERFNHIVACGLRDYIFVQTDVQVSLGEILRHLWVRTPPWWNGVVAQLPDEDDDKFDFFWDLFPRQEADAVQLFNDNEEAFALIGLQVPDPIQSDDLMWNFAYKQVASGLAERLLVVSLKMEEKFSMVSVQASKADAVGSPAQMSSVSTDGAQSEVTTYVNLPAPALSLLLCFPSSGRFDIKDDYGCSVVTTVPFENKRAEFVAMDALRATG